MAKQLKNCAVAFLPIGFDKPKPTLFTRMYA
jgi:hypothetical protein